MNRRLLIALVAAAIGTIVAGMSGVLVYRSAPAADTLSVEMHEPSPSAIYPQPDTKSPHWIPLSDDVGIMTNEDSRFGLRGRLYVSINGTWRSVAVDGPADSGGPFPAR